MGDVIHIKDWKKVSFDKVFAGNKAIENEVRQLMSKAYVLRQEMPRLPTVAAREKAVVDALGYSMKAHEIAKKNGIAISNHPDGTYSVGRYIANKEVE